MTEERKSELVPELNEKNIADSVLIKLGTLMKQGAIRLPKNYSAENALRQAWLILQSTVDKDKNPVLAVCSKESVALALLRMTLQGLDPAKAQGYFIAYGKQLTFQRSYFGELAVMKRVAKIIGEPRAMVVRKGEVFEYSIEKCRYHIQKHTPSIETADADIIAAYAVIEYQRPDGKPEEWVEIMTRSQIESAWSKSRANPFQESKAGDDLIRKLKASSTHAEFTDQMAKKTVLARAAKIIVNTSDDSDLYTTDDDAEQIASGVIIDSAAIPAEPLKIGGTVDAAQTDTEPTTEPGGGDAAEPENRPDEPKKGNGKKAAF